VTKQHLTDGLSAALSREPRIENYSREQLLDTRILWLLYLEVAPRGLPCFAGCIVALGRRAKQLRGREWSNTRQSRNRRSLQHTAAAQQSWLARVHIVTAARFLVFVHRRVPWVLYAA
jgi:hypothetical protein